MQTLELPVVSGPLSVAEDAAEQRATDNGPRTTDHEQLCESVGDFLAEARLEREQGIVRNVALLGPESRNGYRYTLEAMQEAVPLYEGRPVFIDHPDGGAAVSAAGCGRDARAPEVRRSLRDYAGRVLQPRFESNRIRADLQLLGPHASWLMNLIESAPSDIGMSHVVLARRGKTGDEVEHIERVLSVDIVAFPATTQSFREASANVGADQRVCPALGEHLSSGEHVGSPLRKIVEHSRIPPVGRTSELYRLLQACPEPRQMIALIEAYWRQALAETPRSAEKPSPDSAGFHPPLASPQLRRAVISAIRGE